MAESLVRLRAFLSRPGQVEEADPNEAMFQALKAWAENLDASDGGAVGAFKQAFFEYIKKSAAYASGRAGEHVNWAEAVYYTIDNSAAEMKRRFKRAREGKTFVSTDVSSNSSNRADMSSTPLFFHTPYYTRLDFWNTGDSLENGRKSLPAAALGPADFFSI